MQKKLLSVLCFLVVTGCATTPPPQETKVDVPMTRLAQTAEKVEKMLSEMNALERSRQNNPEVLQSLSEQLPADHPLMKRVTATWTGDVRIVLRKLSDQAGIDMAVKGKLPVPLIVSVSGVDVPLVKMLESLGSQLGNSADVDYEDQSHLLVVEYR